MRPYKNLRTGSGYCCERCDGPYAKWKKVNKKHLKRKDKLICNRQTLKEYYDQLEDDERGELTCVSIDRKNKIITYE